MENWGSLFARGDMFAQSVNLNIMGSEKFRTKTGAMITLAFMCCISLISVQLGSVFLDKTNPQSTIESYSTKEYPRVDLVESNLVPFIWAGPNDFTYSTPAEMEYFVTFSAYLLSGVTSPINGDISYLKRQVPVVPCGELSEEELKAYAYIPRDTPLFQAFRDYAVCLKINFELTVRGRGDDLFREYFIFSIFPCSKAAKEQCATPKELDDFEMQIVMPMSNYDSTNYTTPHVLLPNADALYFVTPKLKQRYDLPVQKNMILNNEGVYNSWRNITTYFEVVQDTESPKNRDETNIHCQKESIFTFESAECVSYMELAIKSSGKIQIRKRTYDSLLDILGTIGGISGMISMVLNIIYSFINERKRNNFLLKHAYPLIVAEEHFSTKLVPRKFPFCCLLKKVNVSAFAVDSKRGYGISGIGISRNEALKRVENSLDAISIVKNASLLKVIAELLLKDRHKGLAQLLDLKLWKSETDLQKKQSLLSEGSLTRRRYAKRPDSFSRSKSKRYSDSLLTRTRWVQDLEWHYSNIGKVAEQGSGEDHNSQLLDSLFYDNIVISDHGSTVPPRYQDQEDPTRSIKTNKDFNIAEEALGTDSAKNLNSPVPSFHAFKNPKDDRLKNILNQKTTSLQ